MILVDTSAWIHHLRNGDTRLRAYLLEHRVRTCDVVIGELLLGSGLPKKFAEELQALPHLPSPTAGQTYEFVRRYRRGFAGSGIGWADAQIILGAANSGARLYTSDTAVRRVSRALGIILA